MSSAWTETLGTGPPGWGVSGHTGGSWTTAAEGSSCSSHGLTQSSETPALRQRGTAVGSGVPAETLC